MTETAPVPFTAEQIRAGCPAGRTITFRVELQGRPPFLQVVSFAEVDAEGATVSIHATDLDGRAVGPTREARETWAHYEDEARHPRDAVVIEELDLEVPLGRYRGLRYRITRGDEVRELDYALDLPGPPLRAVVRMGGTVVSTMEAVSD